MQITFRLLPYFFGFHQTGNYLKMEQLIRWENRAWWRVLLSQGFDAWITHDSYQRFCRCFFCGINDYPAATICFLRLILLKLGHLEPIWFLLIDLLICDAPLATEAFIMIGLSALRREYVAVPLVLNAAHFYQKVFLRLSALYRVDSNGQFR